jgi:putative transposase
VEAEHADLLVLWAPTRVSFARRTRVTFSDVAEYRWRYFDVDSDSPEEGGLELGALIKRRTDVVGVLPNPEALLRLAGAVLVEAHDEWQTGDRRYLAEGTMAALITPPATNQEVAHPELIPA